MPDTLAIAESPPRRSLAGAHVVLVTNFIPPYGVPVYQELARRLGRLTILISSSMESNRSWQPDWGGLEVEVQRSLTWRRTWRHAGGFREKLDLHVPWDTLGRLRALAPDCVVSAELGFRSMFAALHKRLRRTPLVLWATLSERTEEGRGWLRMRLRHWLARQADCVVVNGESGARYVNRLGFEPRRTFRAPYVTPQDLFDRVPVERSREAARRLLFVGQFVPRKGLEPFLAVLCRWALDHPGETVEFALTGSGEVESRLAALPLPPNLRLNFLGQCAYAQLPARYADGGILAFPTLADEWGLVVNEAMAAGLPVLGSRYSQAVEELCREGETGWTFRPDVPDEAYRAIDQALSTPLDQLAQMRQAARQCVEHLTPDYVAERLIEAIRAALARGGKPV